MDDALESMTVSHWKGESKQSQQQQLSLPRHGRHLRRRQPQRSPAVASGQQRHCRQRRPHPTFRWVLVQDAVNGIAAHRAEARLLRSIPGHPGHARAELAVGERRAGRWVCVGGARALPREQASR